MAPLPEVPVVGMCGRTSVSSVYMAAGTSTGKLTAMACGPGNRKGPPPDTAVPARTPTKRGVPTAALAGVTKSSGAVPVDCSEGSAGKAGRLPPLPVETAIIGGRVVSHGGGKRSTVCPIASPASGIRSVRTSSGGRVSSLKRGGATGQAKGRCSGRATASSRGKETGAASGDSRTKRGSACGAAAEGSVVTTPRPSATARRWWSTRRGMK